MIFKSHKTSASLCGSKYVQLQPRILITCVYHNREKINYKSADWFSTSIPILSSAEIIRAVVGQRSSPESGFANKTKMFFRAKKKKIEINGP